LNVHPGDLTITENGRRILVGLHALPIETAILKGHTHLRASVILAQPYTGAGGEMDSGPILGVSKQVAIDFMGKTNDALALCKDTRPEKKPKGGFSDALEYVAKHNQEILKEHGDWVVFPPAVEDFASGRFGYDDEDGGLRFLDDNGEWRRVLTVEYGPDGERNLVPER
jgi:hypothetical protein